MLSKDRLRAVDFFCGGGGMTYGLRESRSRSRPSPWRQISQYRVCKAKGLRVKFVMGNLGELCNDFPRKTVRKAA